MQLQLVGGGGEARVVCFIVHVLADECEMSNAICSGHRLRDFGVADVAGPALRKRVAACHTRERGRPAHARQGPVAVDC